MVSNLSAVLRASFNISNKLEVANSIHEPLKTILDGEPLLLPLPDEAPTEIPRISLTSKNNKYQCNISKEFIEFAYREDKPIKGLSELREQYLEVVGIISKVLKDKLRSTIFRNGLVIRFTIPHETPVVSVKDKFIKSGILNTPRALELNVLDRMEWEALIINRWYRIATKTEQSNGEKVISVVYDINTITEKKYDFSVESSVAFFDKACTYVQDSIKTLL